MDDYFRAVTIKDKPVKCVGFECGKIIEVGEKAVWFVNENDYVCKTCWQAGSQRMRIALDLYRYTGG